MNKMAVVALSIYTVWVVIIALGMLLSIVQLIDRRIRRG